MLIEEYRRSLKIPGAEEIFDLILYRPVAFVFVKTIYRLPITPNQVTFLSLLASLASAWYFSIGSYAALIRGAVWYAIANILDCSDGQLARLQQSGTPLGRLVDGMVDYISSIAIFLGIGIGLAGRDAAFWLPAILCGASSALHAIVFDHYQSEFIFLVRGTNTPLTEELQHFAQTYNSANAGSRNGLRDFFLKIYLRYLDIQRTFAQNSRRQAVSKHPHNQDSSMIRWWSFLGPTTNRTALIICALAGRVDVYLWIILLPGNAWLMVCLLRQRLLDRKVKIITP